MLSPDLSFTVRPRVAALGGGHGLAANLTALRRLTDQLTAIVTVADDGGSSGRLREEFEMLPPGDLRMALSALCGDDRQGRLWAEILQSRFGGDGPLAGHAIGNLLIAGIWQKVDAITGLDMVASLLDSRGRVLPMSAVPLEIEADVIGADPTHPDETSVLRGQARVASTRAEVSRIRLVPPDPPAASEATRAIMDAEYVVLGPGSWFTSVIPHLLVPGLAEAISATPARKILTMNLTGAGETSEYTPSGHLEALAEHAPTLRLDVVLADPSFVGDDRDQLATFARSLGAELVVAEVAMRDGSARHDPLRLGAVYADVMGL